MSAASGSNNNAEGDGEELLLDEELTEEEQAIRALEAEEKANAAKVANEPSVGSIAHVLKTTFRDLFDSDDEEEEEEEEEEVPEEDEGEEGEGEEGEEGEEGVDEEEAAAAAKAAEEAAAAEAAAAEAAAAEAAAAAAEAEAAEGEDGEVAEEEEEEEPMGDDELFHPTKARFLDFVLGEDREEEIYVTAHLDEGEAKIVRFEEELETQLDQSVELIRYLEKQTKLATAADLEEKQRLKEEGLLVKAEIPIGPSFLRLEPEVLHSFGIFGSNLVSARKLLQDNLDYIKERSGNGPKASVKTVRYIQSTPGYLRNTDSNKTRAGINAARTTYDEPYKPGPNSTSNRFYDYSSERREKMKKRKNKDHLRPKMAADELDVNIKVLERMNNRLQFLRNPRHNTEPGSAGTKNLLKSESTVTTRPPHPGDHGHFLAIPPKVEFTEYETGVIYEQAILIRNVSQVSRRLRVLPPSTSHFSLCRVDFPGGVDGQVAPGMSCKCTLRFAPDSLADYTDKITAITEMGNFDLQVDAHRTPPSLTIPQTLNGGSCLLGATSTAVFHCANYGGPARFRLLPASEWPNPTTAHRKDCVKIPPFEVTPTEFALRNGESVDIVTKYTPLSIGDHQEQFIMVCDNCQVKAFTVNGLSCIIKLEVAAIQGVPIDLSIANTHPPDLILFDSLPPGATAQKQIEIRNRTPLELEFYWDLSSSSVDGDGDVDMVLGQRPPFHISPSEGAFPASGSMPFSITFHPSDVVNYQVFAKLRIRAVPKCSADPDGESSYTEDLDDLVCLGMQLVGAGEACAVEMNPPLLNFPGSLLPNMAYKQTVTIHNLSIAPTKFHFREAGMDVASVAAEGGDGFIHAGNCLVKVSPSAGRLDGGDSRELQVQVIPQAVGKLRLRVPCDVAHSAGESFELKLCAEVEGARLQLMQEEIDLGLISVGGQKRHELKFKNLSSIPAKWSFSQVPKHLLPPPPAGAAPKKKEKKRKAPPKARSAMEARKQAEKEAARKAKEAEGPAPESSLAVTPAHGIIPPHGECSVSVLCVAGQPERLRAAIECAVENGEPQYIGVRGEVQSPKVFLECQAQLPGDTATGFTIPTSYVNVEVVRRLKLTNLSNLSASYKWDFDPPSGPTKIFDVRFEPSEGTLESKEAQDFTFTFIPRMEFNVKTIFACHVKGMLAPLGFSFKTLTKDIVMNYALLDEGQEIPERYRILENTPIGAEPVAPEPEPLPKLDFANCELFQRKKLRLLLSNFSGIPTRFGIAARKYKYTPPLAGTGLRITGISPEATGADPDEEVVGVGRNARVPMLAATVEKEKFKSELGASHVTGNIQLMEDREVLAGGKGLAMVADPPTGRLLAWESKVVEITLFNNMPGKYMDNLLVDVERMKTKPLIAKANVVGCPLSLAADCVGMNMPPPFSADEANAAVAAAADDLESEYGEAKESEKTAPRPVLKWGQLCHSQPSVTKRIRVLNKGPIDAMVKWRVSDIHGGDHRLVDLDWDVSEDGKIGLGLRYHVKQEIVPPFSVEPERQLVPRHHEAFFNVTLHSLDKPGVAEGLMTADAEWLYANEGVDGGSTSAGGSSLAVGGAMSAVRSQRGGESTVSGQTSTMSSSNVASKPQKREQGALVLQLRADAIEPQLTLDKSKQQGRGEVGEKGQLVQWKTWSTRDSSHKSHHQTIVLSNRTSTPLEFSLATTLPFSITRTHTLAPKNPTLKLTQGGASQAASVTGSGGKVFRLPQGENISVEMAFTPPPRPKKGGKASQLDKTLKLKTRYPPVGESRYLTVNYVNGSTQVIGLQATVFRPIVLVQPSQFNFGQQHVEGLKSQTFFLGNPTEVDANWTVVHIPRPVPKSRAQKAAVAALAVQNGGTLPEDVPEVFEFSIDSGVVQGPTLPIDSSDALVPKDFNRVKGAVFGNAQQKGKMPIAVTVHFNPDRAVRYKSRFRFEVANGEGVDVVLEGGGTLEEGGLDQGDSALRTQQRRIGVKFAPTASGIGLATK